MFKELKEKLCSKKFIKEFIFINIGVFFTAFSLCIFLDPNNLVVGGVGGIGTILTNTIFPNLKLSSIVFVINTVLLLISLFTLGKEFFFKTLYGSLIYPFYCFICELLFDVISKNNLLPIDNLLLIVLFGACITGAGMGLAIKNGGSTGGIDILQNICLKYFHMPLSTSLIIFDGAIVLGGAIISGDFNNILYGILFIVISGYILDNIVFGGFSFRAVHIVSSEHEKIKELIIKSFDRTVTEVYSRGGYSSKETKMLICVLSTKEYYNLRSIINEVDPSAFVYVVHSTEVRGAGFTYEKQYK